MVKHIVLWRLKEEALGRSRQENALLVKEKLEALRGRIPGMKHLEVGIDFSREEASADVVLYSEFENHEALMAYHVHPEHEAVKDFIGAVREERRVADYET